MSSRVRDEPVYRSGLERLCGALQETEAPTLAPDLMRRVRRSSGLLTHPAAVTRRFTSAVEALIRAGAGLAALFGPEHGVRGDAPDGRHVASAVDPRTDLPVYSLYRGGSAATQTPSPEMMEGLEALIVDLQDVGARFYTFASTVSLCMKAAAEAGLPVIVLDRMNPLGRAIEGPLLRPEFESFVGMHPLPIRHGCTIGELALLFHRAYGIGEEPAVVPIGWCDGGGHHGTLEELLRGWVPPSPNMPTPLTALVYPGTCLLEGTNLSEGRGTARPFEWLGAPWIDADTLVDRLRGLDLPGAAFRPVYFAPTVSKWAGETCGGIHLHVTDVPAFRPVLTGLAVLTAVRALWPEQFQWRESGGQFAVDRLVGTDTVRLAIDRGESAEAIASGWKPDEATFHSTRERVRLYS